MDLLPPECPSDSGLVDPVCLCNNLDGFVGGLELADSLHVLLSASPATIRCLQSGSESVLVEV